jgi:hypothetical protein
LTSLGLYAIILIGYEKGDSYENYIYFNFSYIGHRIYYIN